MNLDQLKKNFDFDAVQTSCRRYRRCRCRGGRRVTVWPLDRQQMPATTPPRGSLPSRLLGSRVSYRRGASLLEDLLPGGCRACVTRYAATLYAEGRLELDERVSEPDEYDWRESRREPFLATRNLSVAIDGTSSRIRDGFADTCSDSP
jgi:hypothetical protein